MYFISFLLKNLLRRKTRSGLTILGVAVAVAAMVTCLGIAYGLESSFVQAFEGRGADLVVTSSGRKNQLGSKLPESLGPTIADMQGVKEVRPGVLEMMSIKTQGGNDIGTFVNGWPIDSPLFNALTMLSGRKLQPGDRRRVMLGEAIASNLEKQVGDTVVLDTETFYVVGVFRSFNVFENGSVIIPLPEAQEWLGLEGLVTGFTVVLHDTPDRPAVAERVAHDIETLKDKEGRPYRLSARPAQDYVKESMPIKLAHGIAWFFSIFPAVMGAVVMLITMLTSVLERIKEIGILRAMGWKKSRVVRMILGEALLLSSIGAVLGCLGAIGLIRWLSMLAVTNSFVQGDVPPITLLYGVVTALVVALIGGAWPAWQAAQLLPTEALRHE